MKKFLLGAAIVLSLSFAVQAKADQPQCVINNFSISQSSVSYGSQATLNWSTNYCTSVSIYGGSLNNQTNLPPYGSISTGSLYGTTTFYINAYGPYNSASSQSAMVYVSGQYNSGYQYSYDPSPFPTYTPCTITSFTANPTSVFSGSNATLNWKTNGCTSVTLTGPNISDQNPAPNGSTTTGALYGTSTYILTAKGDNGNYYNNYYSYSNTNITTDSKSLVIMINPGNNGQVSVPTTNVSIPTNVVTGQPTNIRTTSARLNGFFNQSPSANATVSFQWGTNPTFSTSTVPQSTGFVSYTPFYDTIVNLYPNTVYYYRAVATTSSNTVYGSVMSFRTPTVTTIVKEVEEPKSEVQKSGIGIGTNLIAFGMSSTPANICVGNVIDYVITYQNISEKDLINAIVQVVIPSNIEIRGVNPGTFNSDEHTVTLSVGTITAGQTGTINLSGVLTKNSSNENLLVANATIAFTNSQNNIQDGAVAYAVNTSNSCPVEKDNSNLAGLALFGTGFWPTNLVGWLATILGLLGLVYLAKLSFIDGNSKVMFANQSPKVRMNNSNHQTNNQPAPHYEEMNIPLFEEEE